MNKALNKSIRMLMAGAAIAALSASVYAHDGEDCEHGGHGGMMDRDPARMEKYHEQHLARLHDKLKLTAQQEPAWKKFTAQTAVPQASARPDRVEMEKLNAPQRMEKGLEHMKAMEARMADHLAALKEFYAVLTPDQQKIFDEQMHHWRHHGHGHDHEQ